MSIGATVIPIERRKPSNASKASLLPNSGLNFKDFPSEFDILEELKNNKDDYANGTESLALVGFPRYLQTCVRRIQSRVQSPYKPGAIPTIVCCMVYGIQQIEEDPHIQELTECRSKLDEVDEGVDMVVLESVAAWFRHYDISIPDGTLSGNYRQNLKVPESLKMEMYRLAGELGVSLSVLGTFAVVIALVDHPSMITEQAEEMKKAVKVFFRSVEIRAKVARMLLTLI